MKYIWRLRLLYLLSSIIFWVLAVFLFAMIRFYGIGETDMFETEIPLNLQGLIIQSLLIGTLLGVLGGLVNQSFSSTYFRKFSYPLLLVMRVVTLFFLTVLVFAILFWMRTRLILNGFADNAELEEVVLTQVQEHERYKVFKQFLMSKSFGVLMVYIFFMTNLQNLVILTRNKFGPRVLSRLIMGKYHQPKEEQRIFMFLDMQSATTHAEQLGHTRFSRMIQECFRDLTGPVLAHKAEIVQYVGDEAMLTWSLKNGLSEANCLRLKFAFDEVLNKRRAFYMRQFGLVPVFKAGVHLGPVMVTEVGVLKREISYHGDVVNTAARIEGQCNGLGVGMLVSKYVYEGIQDANGLQFNEVGALALKGKEEEVNLYEVVES